MTGRQLIRDMLDMMTDLDEEVVIEIVYRDSMGCVTHATQTTKAQFINALKVEGDTLVAREEPIMPF